MSKSLGNFFMVIDILEHYDPETLRFFIVSTHYRSPLDFSDARLTEAQKSLARLRQAQETLGELSEMLSAGPTAESLALREKVKELREAFMELCVMTSILRWLSAICLLWLRKSTFTIRQLLMPALNRTVSWLLCSTMSLQKPALSSVYWKKLLLRLQKRQATARKLSWWKCLSLCVRMHEKNKNYALADELRNKLNEIGIVLQDTPQGVKWSKQ